MLQQGDSIHSNNGPKYYALCVRNKCQSLTTAAAPLHWIYDQDKVKGLTEEKGVTEFYPTSQCPYYIIETGQNSAYGDQLFATLKTLAEYKGQEKPAIPKPAARCGLPVCPLHSPTPVASMHIDGTC